MKKTALLYFLFFALAVATGQTPNYFKVGEQTFQGVDIYSLQFHNGLLYVATNNGLYKQKGVDFVKIPFKNEEALSLFGLTEDNNGGLYCKALNGKIFKVESDTLELVYQLDKDMFGGNFYFFFNADNNLIVTGKAVFKIDKNGEKVDLSSRAFKKDSTKKRITFYTHKLEDGTLYIAGGDINYYGLIYNNNELELLKSNEKLDEEFGGDSYYYKKGKSQFLFSKTGRVHSLSNGKIEVDNTNQECFHLLKDTSILGRAEKGGVRILTIKDNVLTEDKKLFDSQFVSAVTQKKSKDLFLGTFGEGIIVVPNYKQTKKETAYSLKSIAATKSQLFFSSREKGILEYEQSLVVLDSNGVGADGVFYAQVVCGSAKEQQYKIMYKSNFDIHGSVKDVCNVNDSVTLYVDHLSCNVVFRKTASFDTAGFVGIGKSSALTDSTIHLIFKEKNRFNAVTADKKGENIYVSDRKSVVELRTKKELFYNGASIPANDLAFHNKVLVIGTKNEGVLFINNSSIERKIDVDFGLESNAILKLKLHEDKLYIQTKVGLQVYDLVDEKLYNLNAEVGFLTENLIDFDVFKNELWIVEKNTFYSIPLVAIFGKKEKLEFSITKLLVNGSKVELKDKIRFSSQQNKFQFQLQFNDVIKAQDAYYTYKLNGFDDSTYSLSAKNGIINYDYIPSGSYDLEVTLCYNNVEHYTVHYTFKIAPIYYKTWWFFTLILLVVIAIAFMVFKWRIRKISQKNLEALEKERLSKNMLDSELKALRSQMNPHFMFNSLNSIQHLILKEDIENSYDYIVMFSELVRNTLNYSEQEFISIEKEIKFLEVYLELEKLRFKKDFEYIIHSNVPKNIQVPSILIQPFIENALKHGLLHKKGLKKLSVELIYNEGLTCIIKDNGVGRKAAAEVNKRERAEHQSFAMGSITKRLEILSERYQDSFKFEVIDLEIRNEPIGTEVRLNMPFKSDK